MRSSLDHETPQPVETQNISSPAPVYLSPMLVSKPRRATFSGPPRYSRGKIAPSPRWREGKLVRATSSTGVMSASSLVQRSAVAAGLRAEAG
jgi:hypothetical protein